ncbi:hypothetical protein QR685DRAFT_568324 [Neurospora intermedia]|uniref:Uncharacterized protein n=1 Tax=Neurospora intermedia TaxID=5142 RepID=A0ABR3DSB6_NEUIN
MSSPSTLMLLQLFTHWPSGTPDDTHVRRDSPSAHKQFTQKYGRGFEAERTFANAPQSILTGDCVQVVVSASDLFLH